MIRMLFLVFVNLDVGNALNMQIRIADRHLGCEVVEKAPRNIIG